jgi:hypothetical protein
MTQLAEITQFIFGQPFSVPQQGVVFTLGALARIRSEHTGNKTGRNFDGFYGTPL